MALIFRWLIRIATTLIIGGVAIFVLAYYFASRSLPDYNATTPVTGISAPVEIVRDNANVPHIFGQTDDDVFFGLGYAHAQDRLWQMTKLRRAAQGRLAEVFGPAELPNDRLARRFDIYNLAVKSVSAQDDATQSALNAYAAGVNAWLTEVNAGARGRGAPEMWLFSQSIAPWQPADSLAILKLHALHQTKHLQHEVLRARTALMIGNDKVQDILPDAPGTPITALPEYAQYAPGLPRYAGTSTAIPAAGASNAWAANPSRSASGATLLASDPHMTLTAPSVWYLARLDLRDGGVIGGTIPGIPVVLTGRSAELGWGMTTTNLDDQDITLEELNPDNPDQYRGPDGWVPFQIRDSIINVRDANAITLKLRWTANGPVIPSDKFNLSTITPPGHVTAVAWTGLSDQDPSMTALMNLMQAKTVGEAVRTTQNFIAPAQNLILADRNRIAMQTIGAQPSRDPDHQTQGRLPSYGYEAQNRWNGRLPYGDNPRFMNPPGGIVGNTNNKISDSDFPAHISYVWEDSQRIKRWEFLMQSRQVHTRDSFIEAQLDTVSPAARATLSLVAADLWFTGDAAPDGTPERQRQIALELLGAWNGEMNEHLPEPLIYATWLRELQKRLIRDDLGPLSDAFDHPDPVFIDRVFRNSDGAGAWCDVLQSAASETCTDIARQSLDAALIWIAENHTGRLESLRWGDAHQATHDHPDLGTAPILNWFVNIRQSTSGGDHTLQRGLTSGTGANPYENVNAAGYRGVYDFADPDSSVFITATGQSGHPLSRYYDNLGELWRRGEYIPMSLDPDLARAAAVGVTLLEPE